MWVSANERPSFAAIQNHARRAFLRGLPTNRGYTMKTKLPIWIAVLGLTAVCASAWATPVTDNYNGADGHGYGDVIGTSTYDINSMDATRSGNQLTITIYTNFAGHAGLEPQWTKNHTGIGYGDLFLSTGWTPYGSAPYNKDNAANGNHWTYAFALNDPLSNSGGSGTVYALGAGIAGNNNPDVLLSNNFITCGGSCIYRNGQAVAVNKNSATATTDTGTWTVGKGFLSFTFDVAGLNLNTDDLGFHWGMYCGNDVIEGLSDATVPEPKPLGFFVLGLGLIGLGVARQRKSKREMVS